MLSLHSSRRKGPSLSRSYLTQAFSCAVLLHHKKSVKASHQAKNFLVEFARDYPTFQVVVAKIEHAPQAAERHNVVSVPTTIFFKVILFHSGLNIKLQDGHELARFEGYKPINIREKAIQTTRLVDLIKQSKLMLFMKGTPEEPKCGMFFPHSRFTEFFL